MHKNPQCDIPAAIHLEDSISSENLFLQDELVEVDTSLYLIFTLLHVIPAHFGTKDAGLRYVQPLYLLIVRRINSNGSGLIIHWSKVRVLRGPPSFNSLYRAGR